MKFFVSTIYNKASNQYMPPFLSRTLIESHRMFKYGLKQAIEKNEDSFDLSDYQLFQVGWFNDETGILEGSSLLEQTPNLSELEAIIGKKNSPDVV